MKILNVTNTERNNYTVKCRCKDCNNNFEFCIDVSESALSTGINMFERMECSVCADSGNIHRTIVCHDCRKPFNIVVPWNRSVNVFKCPSCAAECRVFNMTGAIEI